MSDGVETPRRPRSVGLGRTVAAGLCALLALCVVQVASAGSPRTLNDPLAGIQIEIPSGWSGSRSALHASGNTIDRLHVSTSRLERPPGGLRCPARALLRMLPSDGAAVWVLEHLSSTRAELRALPRRPRQFTLSARDTTPCFRGAYRWRFREGGRATVVVALVGAEASAETKEQVLAAAGSVTVSSVVVGRSRQGRAIRLHAAGNLRAKTRVLVIGCIHGDECAAAPVIQRLRATPARSFDLWIVPTLNPDGVALGQRQNANGVDLNRNFPGTWASGRGSGRGDRYYPGTRAASEPETRVGMKIVRRIRPDIAIWFHQPEVNVRAGGGSEQAAKRYARMVGLPYLRLPVPAGAATAWQTRVFAASQAFVVELPAGRLDSVASARHVRAVRALGSR
jgi:protein MpaA